MFISIQVGLYVWGKILSLTLRDAKHLAWKTFKKFEKLDAEKAAKLGSLEVLAKRAAEIAQKDASLTGSSVGVMEYAKLLSETLFSLLVLAEKREISLEDSFLESVDEMILGFVS
jgi:hypothetical protein